MGSPPKIPDPVPPPPPPPAPTQMAEKVENKGLKSKAVKKKTSGTASLTVRRPTVNTGSSGSGANINY